MYQLLKRKLQLSPDLINEIRFEMHMLKVRRSFRHYKRQFEGRKDMLINVGCGPNARPGWINIDGYAGQGIDALVDIRRGLPFGDQTVRGIFCEHVVEHLRFDRDFPNFLRECKRVLQPQGVIRIIVPDAGRYLHAYVSDGWDSISALRPLGPHHEDAFFRVTWKTKMELVNLIFRQGGEHKFGWDFETLSLVLKQYFPVVVQQRCHESQLPELAIDQESRAAESLYVEASGS